MMFSKMPDCVGWATWKNSWKKLKKALVYMMYIMKKFKIIIIIFPKH